MVNEKTLDIVSREMKTKIKTVMRLLTLNRLAKNTRYW